MRKVFISFSAVICLFSASAARADVDYNLTLTTTTGCACDGTGSFEIATAPNAAPGSVSTYKQGKTLDSLIFNIGGDTFDLSDAKGSLLQFTSGTLSDITYEGTFTEKVGKTKITISFQQNGLEYQFQDNNKNENSTGIITAELPISSSVSATPEPGSLLLLGTGMLGIAGAARRRLFA